MSTAHACRGIDWSRREVWPTPGLLILLAAHGLALTAFFQPMQYRFDWADHASMVAVVFILTGMPLVLASMIRRAWPRLWVDALFFFFGLPTSVVIPLFVFFPWRDDGVSLLGMEILDHGVWFNYWGESMILQQVPVIALEQLVLWTAAGLLRRRI